MKRSTIRWALGLLLASGLAAQVRADSITNNFTTSADFLNSGVGGTMWDGVYLGVGDIYGGDSAGDAGATLLANETAFPGFLAVQSTRTDWAGTGDDGFFLFKVVAGDFDMSVENAPPFANPNYHFGGLMARAYATGPHWGAPYNGAENWQDIMRFQEFSIGDDIRYATNGVDHDGYVDVPGTDADTTTTRFYRITRVGDVFNFYTKTNQPDAWVLQGSLSRSDLSGVPMQVGIADATFGGTTPTTYYTDFELTGTNVASTVVSPASPTGLTATPNVGGTITFSWTAGAGSDGSILVMRKNNPVILNQKPINGFTYNANTNFSSGDDIGGAIYAVYAGAGNSATISGLGSTNQSYSVAVYSYKGAGAATVYGTSPVTNSVIGLGVPQGINYTLSPTNGVPVGGVAVPVVVLFDNIGDTDILASSSLAWSSSDNTVLTVGTDGTFNGMGVGTAQVIATYNTFSATNSVTVHTPTYTNNFATSHDFLVNGLSGTTFDGLFLTGNDIPNATFGPPLANVTAFDANTTSNNVLTIKASNSGWQGGNDNGPFLYKVVPGDFQASVHITGYSVLNYEFIGLQARAFNTTDNASPSSANFRENFVAWLRFDEFGISTATFNTINGNNTETDQTDGDGTQYWLLMVRANATNFYFFKKANLTDPWSFQPSETIVRPDLTNGTPMEVGMVQSMFTANLGTVQYDSFSLDAVGISGGVPPSATTGLTMTPDSTFTQETLSWVAGTNSDGSASTSFVIMRANSPISAQPTFGITTGANPVFGQGTDLGGGNFVVFRGVGNTVTVTGLKPGTTYYAAVYGYSSSGVTKSFNILGSTTTNTPPVTITGITASLAPGGIPVGGVGFPVVIGQIQGGGTLDVTKAAQISSNNTNVMVATNGILTGLAVGSATNTFSFVSGGNTLTTTLVATVRASGYRDNFGVPHDYIVNGITNTSWDGVYAQPGVIPGTTYVNDPLASISAADADTTSNNVLNVTSENTGWEGTQNNGFFLFKNVTGDFQASVHISYLNANGLYDGADMVNYNNPGILARAYTTNGAPAGGNGRETWISFTRFDLFGFGTYARRTINNGTTQSTQPGGFNGAGTASDTNLWLLVVRQNTTNFSFFQRQFATDPWHATPNGTTYSPTNFANAPLQVGLLAGGFNSGAAVTVGFDNFMLDQSVALPTLSAGASGKNFNVSWLPQGTFSLQYSLSLSSPAWQPVGTAPVNLGGTNTVTVPATNPAAFFRLIQ